MAAARPAGLAVTPSLAVLVMGAAVGAAVGAAACRAGDDEPRLLVFAAASTTDALGEAAAAFTARTGLAVTPVFAASSTLARQIEQGAPADLYLSASVEWMDYLQQRDLLVSGTRADLLGNSLVLIAPAASPLGEVDLVADLDLPRLLGDGRLAVGDPDHVPAGRYARAALESLGVWPVAAPRLARQNDVRSALALVERGETPLGIVYATDAAVSARVKVVATFPAGGHPPIVYPVALLRDTPGGRAFLAFLAQPEAGAIFRRRGFRTD